jgi:predicted transposase YdaD
MAPILPKIRHDRSYRLLFSQPRMVEDLIRRFVADAWIEQLDFSTLERLNASYVSENLQGREGDLVWRLRLRNAPEHVYVLVEFQSDVQRFMALRQMAYLALFYQQVLKNGELTSDGRLPLVLSVVVYNGKARWTAALEISELVRALGEGSAAYVPRLRYRLVDMEACGPAELSGRNLVALLIRIERSRTRAGLRRVIRELVAALAGPDEGGLRRAFVVWLQRVLLPAKGEEDIPELVDLEEFRVMLIERVEEWSRQIATRAERKGVKKGLDKGLKKGSEIGQRELLLHQLEVKFGEVDARTRSRVQAAAPELLLEWAERLLSAEKISDVFGK